jgi:hypothetical protein
VCVRQLVAIPQLWGAVRGARYVKAAHSSSGLAALGLFRLDRKAMPGWSRVPRQAESGRRIWRKIARTRRRIDTADGTRTDETKRGSILTLRPDQQFRQLGDAGRYAPGFVPG